MNKALAAMNDDSNLEIRYSSDGNESQSHQGGH